MRFMIGRSTEGLMWIEDGNVIRFADRLRARGKNKSEPTLAWLTGFSW